MEATDDLILVLKEKGNVGIATRKGGPMIERKITVEGIATRLAMDGESDRAKVARSTVVAAAAAALMQLAMAATQAQEWAL